MKNFIPRWILLLTVLFTLQYSLSAQITNTAKNVIFIMADDLNDNLGCYGHPLVKTPNIDRLAARGMKFTNAHSNHPICNPSRTSLLAGLYSETTKVCGNDVEPRSSPVLANHVMLEEYFEAHGYFTARCGKIAHDHPQSFAQGYYWDINKPNAPPKVKTYNILASGGALTWVWEATDQLDENTTDGSNARYIANLVKQNKAGPFFIALGFRKPHVPWIAPKKYFDMYPISSIKLPTESGEPLNDRNDIPEIALTQATEYLNLDDLGRRQSLAAYYASVSCLDAQLGVLLDTLDRENIWQDTVVVFVSDHGFHLGEHGGLANKLTNFSEVTRVPFIIAAPGRAPGVCDKPVELVDLYKTLSDICGLPVPSGIQGKSIVPLLANPSGPWTREGAYTVVHRSKTENPDLGRSLRTAQYRYTEWINPTEISQATAELYDLQADAGEFNNLVGQPAYDGVIMNLAQKLDEAQTRAVTITDPPVNPNLVINPGFDLGTSNWANWSGSGVVNGAAHLVSSAAQSIAIHQTIQIPDDGSRYVVSGRIRADSIAQINSVDIVLAFRNSLGQTIGTNTYLRSTRTGAYESFSSNPVIVPSGTKDIRIQIRILKQSTSATADFDDISVVKQ